MSSTVGSGAFGVPQPYLALRCGRCNKLLAEHLRATEMIMTCPRCKAVVAINGERRVNAERAS